MTSMRPTAYLPNDQEIFTCKECGATALRCNVDRSTFSSRKFETNLIQEVTCKNGHDFLAIEYFSYDSDGTLLLAACDGFIYYDLSHNDYH